MWSLVGFVMQNANELHMCVISKHSRMRVGRVKKPSVKHTCNVDV